MRSHRLTLAVALLLSAAVHALLVAGGEVGLPDFYTSPDEVLESRKPARVQRVQLAARPAAAVSAARKPAGLHVAKAAPAQRLHRKKDKEVQPPPPATPDAPAGDTAAVAEVPPSSPPRPPEAMPVAPSPEPAPAFPVQLSAQLDARVSGLSATLHQRWIMEGFRYSIDVKGSKFGFKAQLTSEGRISPEGGLTPERSQTILGGKVQSFTEYGNGIIRFGKPSNVQEKPLPVIPQDFASVPFHLAVTFNGQPQTLFISTGRRVYQARFTLVAEEKLRLPVGALRTLHLSGERFDYDLRQMVQAYDIWLAPDYLNFPVKVSGHLSGGEPIEYRVSALEIEGKVVLGEEAAAETPVAEEPVPEWLQERARQDALKNP